MKIQNDKADTELVPTDDLNKFVEAYTQIFEGNITCLEKSTVDVLPAKIKPKDILPFLFLK